MIAIKLRLSVLSSRGGESSETGMAEIGIEELNRDHLSEFWFIEAVDETTRVRVQDSKRLLPFVGPNHPGTQVKTLYVRVPLFDEAALELVTAKVERLAALS
jgi:hypothetical protein